MKEIKVGICTGCLERAEIEHDDFLKELRLQLEATQPESTWQIETYSCLRFCPEGRVSVVAPRADDPTQGQLSMSRTTSVEDVCKVLVQGLSVERKV